MCSGVACSGSVCSGVCSGVVCGGGMQWRCMEWCGKDQKVLSIFRFSNGTYVCVNTNNNHDVKEQVWLNSVSMGNFLCSCYKMDLSKS